LGDEHSLGETMSPQASGKLFGFSSDHTEREGSFRVIVPGDPAHGTWPWPKQETFISLAYGESFRMWVGNGRVKVELDIGPVSGPSAEVRINGRRIGIPASFVERVVKVTGEAVSPTGVLTITGSADLPLMDVTVTQLSAGDPNIADSATNQNLQVMWHIWGWGCGDWNREPAGWRWNRWDAWGYGSPWNREY
jgi:hypothetical protein